MKFTRIPESAFKELVLNAGYLATTFDPTVGTAPEESALLGARPAASTYGCAQLYRLRRGHRQLPQEHDGAEEA